MAGPIAHIVCALTMLNVLNNVKNPAAFIRGSVFPDIRYLGVVDREETHDPSVTFQKVKDEKDSFLAGVLLHSLVDLAREKYMQEAGAYRLFDDFRLEQIKGHIFKHIEDRWLYNHTDINWLEVIAQLLQYVNDDVEQFDVKQFDAKRWYDLVAQYCEHCPTVDEAVRLVPSNPAFSADTNKLLLGKIKQLVDRYEKNAALQRIIAEFYLNIYTHLTEFESSEND